jgi:hypothetical protein
MREQQAEKLVFCELAGFEIIQVRLVIRGRYVPLFWTANTEKRHILTGNLEFMTNVSHVSKDNKARL